VFFSASGIVSIVSADGHAVTLRMSTPASATDQRSIALEKVFAPAVASFAKYEPHYNGSLIKQGSELEAIASGDLEMSITSAQE
jgi:TRAP-type C4-dicarboxylate transport system substrate-binding protein